MVSDLVGGLESHPHPQFPVLGKVLALIVLVALDPHLEVGVKKVSRDGQKSKANIIFSIN